jgi:hypothetical protein
MHDTTVDAFHGESLRGGLDVEQQMRDSGYDRLEIELGIWPAVVEFLLSHKGEWRLKERFTNNNGLTVLERVA